MHVTGGLRGRRQLDSSPSKRLADFVPRQAYFFFFALSPADGGAAGRSAEGLGCFGSFLPDDSLGGFRSPMACLPSLLSDSLAVLLCGELAGLRLVVRRGRAGRLVLELVDGG